MELDELFGRGRHQPRDGYGQQFGRDDEEYRTSQSYNQHYENDDDYRPTQPYGQKYGNNDDYRPSQPYNQQYESKLKIISSLTSNPKIRLLLILGAIVIIGIMILLIIVLFPLILKLLGYIGDNGIQGILDTIWKGTK
jgi:hypothetical protein